MVLLLGVGIAAFVYAMATPAKISLENEKKTFAALEQVKEALIGRAAADSTRPGSFPCPDIDNDGVLTLGIDYGGGGTCTSNIGRLPWRTLGLPDLRDGSGERLWYALSINFQDASGTIITSDTLGTLTVYSNPGSTSATASTLTTQAVAVIFAPGAALDTQDRSSSTTMSCTSPSGTIARNRCASNYLDIAVGPSGNIDNTTTNGPFIQAHPSTTFNDRLLVITAADLMPVVEQRVAREMMSLLRRYYSMVGSYPWADDNITPGSSTISVNRGRFPCNIALPLSWGNLSPLTPSLPTWLTNGCGSNGWASVTYYALATLPGVTPLTVDGVPGTDVLLITPGAATASPRGAWPTAYFEDSENNNNNNDSYITPTSTAYNRDRLYRYP